MLADWYILCHIRCDTYDVAVTSVSGADHKLSCSNSTLCFQCTWNLMTLKQSCSARNFTTISRSDRHSECVDASYRRKALVRRSGIANIGWCVRCSCHEVRQTSKSILKLRSCLRVYDLIIQLTGRAIQRSRPCHCTSVIRHRARMPRQRRQAWEHREKGTERLI
jgi:hypothetical protein